MLVETGKGFQLEEGYKFLKTVILPVENYVLHIFMKG